MFGSNDRYLAVGAVLKAAEDLEVGGFMGRLLKDAHEGSQWQSQGGWQICRHSLASRLIEEGKSNEEIKVLIGGI